MKQNYFLRMFTILLCLCITTHSYAEVYSGSCGENVSWSLDTESGLLEITGSGEMGEFMLFPPWYNYRSYIKECTIEDGVTTIGANAFRGCTGLTNITIPNSVTSIGKNAFGSCNGLTNITIPNSVTSIGDYAFRGCTGLTNITIPNSVTDIGSEAFRDCTGLTNITIPNSVTSIGESAFSGCDGLTSITIPNSVTDIGSKAFYGCINLTSVHITDIAAWCNITFVDYDSNPLSYAKHLYLNGKEIKDLVIPDDVTRIRANAFSGCDGLTSITIPNSVYYIGDYAFNNCDGLTSITIPNSVFYIGHYAFYNCTGLTSVNIPNSVTIIRFCAFMGCTRLTNITIPNSVYYIEDYAFNNCTGLTSVNIPNSVTTIGSEAFEGCNNLKTIYNLSDLNITKGSSSYGCVAYYADKVIKPDSQIEDFFFIESSEGNTLCGYIGNESNLTLPEDYKGGNYSIGESAFYNCKKLTSVTIPNSVYYIGDYAFNNCDGLTSITIPNSVFYIGNYAFYNCTGLTSVTIPNSVTSFGESAFDGCANLTSLTIGNKITNISSNAFAGCTALNSIIWNAKDYPDLATAEEMPFKDSQITSITFGEDVTSVPKFLCNGMTSLKEVIFPQSLTSIRHNAFENCTGLTSITLPQNVRKIGPSAFAGCSNIKSIYCLAQEPPICSSDALNGIDTWDCTLYVPEGRTSAYMSDPLWREFFDIFEITGIDAPKADKNTSAFDIYNQKGQLVRKAATTTQGLKSGLYIINSKKIWVR